MVPLRNQWSPDRKNKYELESIKVKNNVQIFEDKIKTKNRRQRKEYSIKPKLSSKRSNNKPLINRRKKEDFNSPMTRKNNFSSIKINGLKGHRISKEFVKLVHMSQASYNNENQRRPLAIKSKRGRGKRSYNRKLTIKKPYKEDVSYRITNGVRKSRPSFNLTNFPKNPRRKPRTRKKVDLEGRIEQKLKWAKEIKELHLENILEYDFLMKKFLEESPFQYYFKKILSIEPPKNDVAPLYLGENTSDKPLLIIVYEGILGFKFKDNIAGVDWFMKNKVPKKATSRHIQSSSMFDFLRKAVIDFQVVLIFPKKNEFYKEIAESIIQTMRGSLSGIFYIRLQNKTTKTLDIKNILNNFSLKSTKEVVYLAPINTDEKFLRSRRPQRRHKLGNLSMVDCRFLTYNEFWEFDRIIPMNSNKDKNCRLITCFTPNLAYSTYRKSRKVKTGVIGEVEHSYENLNTSLKSLVIGSFLEVKEILLPDCYYKLMEGYNKESLCEHHAILKLLLSQGVEMHYEDEKENFNIAFNYKKLKMFENMRELGVSENNTNSGMSLLKRNQKNMNNIVKYFQLGENINGKKMEIFKHLRDFSNLLAVKNLDLDAIVGISEDMYLV